MLQRWLVLASAHNNQLRLELSTRLMLALMLPLVPVDPPQSKLTILRRASERSSSGIRGHRWGSTIRRSS